VIFHRQGNKVTYGGHITPAEWNVIQKRYCRGVSREVLMREHGFSRSAWRQHLMGNEETHKNARVILAQRMDDVYRTTPSMPIHYVTTVIDTESSIVSEMWPNVRRRILKDRAWQEKICELALSLVKQSMMGSAIREAVGRGFGYTSWEGLRKSVLWHKDIYRKLTSIINQAPDKLTSIINQVPDELTAASKPKPPKAVPSTLAFEDNVVYIVRGSDVYWRYLRDRPSDPGKYYCRVTGWTSSMAYKRIQDRAKTTAFPVDK
jgi:hypothetical protein